MDLMTVSHLGGTDLSRVGEEGDGREKFSGQTAEVENGGGGNGGRLQIIACDGETEIKVNNPESSQDDMQSDAPPLCPPPIEVELTPGLLSSDPSNVNDVPSEPCWYCLRSLDPGYHPGASQQDSDSLSLLPSGGQKMNYQTDPRPHFGVACSSHAPCRPLWGSEGPSCGLRGTPDGTDDDEQQQTQRACPHCHLALPADTLTWHETKCLQFDGLRNPNK